MFSGCVALLIGLLSSEASSQAALLVEAGLGPVASQSSGLQPSWLNPEFGFGVDLFKSGHFRLSTLFEYHVAQVNLPDSYNVVAYAMPVLRLNFREDSSIHHSLQVGGTNTFFGAYTNDPSYKRLDVFAAQVQYMVDTKISPALGIGLGISSAFVANQDPQLPSKLYCFLEGHWYLQIYLGGGSK